MPIKSQKMTFLTFYPCQSSLCSHVITLRINTEDSIAQNRANDRYICRNHLQASWLTFGRCLGECWSAVLLQESFVDFLSVICREGCFFKNLGNVGRVWAFILFMYFILTVKLTFHGHTALSRYEQRFWTETHRHEDSLYYSTMSITASKV